VRALVLLVLMVVGCLGQLPPDKSTALVYWNCGHTGIRVWDGDGNPILTHWYPNGPNGDTEGGPTCGWFYVAAGGISYADCDSQDVATASVAGGRTYSMTIYGGYVNPPALRQLSAGDPDVLSAWSAGFGFGLTVFGFGWILRLTRRIPETG